MKKFTGSLLAVMFAFSLSTAAAGPDGPAPEVRKKIRQACKADVEKLCNDSTNRREVRSCMIKNRDKLSQACKDAIAEARKGHKH